MKQANIKVTVFRKSEDSTDHRYVTYQVPYQEGLTVLECLIWIYDNIDGTLAVHRSCGETREAACGLCAVLVDKLPVLACKTIVTRREMVVEPLSAGHVIADLMMPKYPARDFEVLEEEIIRKKLCTACGACVAACPTFALKMADETPTLVGVCNWCEACYYSCPPLEMDLLEAGKSLFGGEL